MPHSSSTSADSMEDAGYLHLANTEPIPGYRLIAPLGKGGFGEVWKCEAPGGLLKAIKFVQGDLHALDSNAAADEELRAIQRVKSIRHPFILSMERVEIVGDELVIVCELADRSLADVLAEERKFGKTGISRSALLAYMREAAEALDVMHVRHGLQHLDVKPQNLFLVSNHIKVGDFGLVQSVGGTGSGKVSLGAITPLYASPEVFQGQLSQHCDQYSLAIVYQELLTGTLPFDGRNSRQLMMQHIQGEPNLDALPEADRPILRRALSKEPSSRFPCCSDLATALVTGQFEVGATVVELPLENSSASHPDVDTRKIQPAKTVKARPLDARPPSRDGLEYVQIVSRTPLTEVWQAKTTEDEPRLVKVLFACGVPTGNLERLRGLLHPQLIPIEVRHSSPGKVVLATQIGGRSLKESVGQVGLTTSRLLASLYRAALALDTLAGELGLAHLGLNSRSFVFERDELKITDFGINQLIWLPAGQALASLNPKFNAPELARQPGPLCDQYSLGLVVHELLTSGLPPTASGGGFVFDRVAEPLRPVLARALNSDPKKRFACSGDFLRALLEASGESIEVPVAAPAPELSSPSSRPGTKHDPAHQAPRVRPPIRITPGVLQLRFGTNLAADAIPQRFHSFAEQWQARIIEADPRAFHYVMPIPRGFMQRVTAKSPDMEVSLLIGDPDMKVPQGVQVRTEVRLEIRPSSCTQSHSQELLDSVAPLLVESLRQHLQTPSRGRQQDRVVWPYSLSMVVIQSDGRVGPPVECQGKDISLNGIGFYIPGQLPSSHVRLTLPRTPQTAPMTVQARIVRVQGCGDGWYEVGAVLLPPDELPADDE